MSGAETQALIIKVGVAPIMLGGGSANQDWDGWNDLGGDKRKEKECFFYRERASFGMIFF